VLFLFHQDDDLQCPSSFNSASSMVCYHFSFPNKHEHIDIVAYCLFGVLQGLISGMRNEGSHFGNNYETRDLRNRLPRVASEVRNLCSYLLFSLSYFSISLSDDVLCC